MILPALNVQHIARHGPQPPALPALDHGPCLGSGADAVETRKRARNPDIHTLYATRTRLGGLLLINDDGKTAQCCYESHLISSPWSPSPCLYAHACLARRRRWVGGSSVGCYVHFWCFAPVSRGSRRKMSNIKSLAFFLGGLETPDLCRTLCPEFEFCVERGKTW